MKQLVEKGDGRKCGQDIRRSKSRLKEVYYESTNE